MNEDNKRAPARKETRAKRWSRYLSLAADVGGVVMSLRDKPGALDWASTGFRVAGLAIKWAESRHADAPGLWQYFEDDKWVQVPSEFHKLILAYSSDLVVAEEYLSADAKSPYVVHAQVGRETVAWGLENGTLTAGPYLLEDRKAETYGALGEKLWAELGGRQILYGRSGLVLDTTVDRGVIATAQMTQLLERVIRFRAAKEPRAYLLEGPPGTGKSLAIRWLVERLNMSSVRIDMGMLARNHDGYGSAVATSLDTILQLLRPQAMILDDIDRVEVSAPLLSFLERARQTCSVIIASANSLKPMQGATIRPGRFDDIVRVEFLDRSVLEVLLKDDPDLVDRLSKLPAAYVAEFAKRRKVLGRDQALAELDGLIKRSKDGGEIEDE